MKKIRVPTTKPPWNLSWNFFANGIYWKGIHLLLWWSITARIKIDNNRPRNIVRKLLLCLLFRSTKFKCSIYLLSHIFQDHVIMKSNSTFQAFLINSWWKNLKFNINEKPIFNCQCPWRFSSLASFVLHCYKIRSNDIFFPDS